MAKKQQGRQRGSIAAEGPGKFRVRIYVGTDAQGKREYVSRLVVGSRSDAEKERTKLLTELDTNTLARPTGETLGAFLPRFLDTVKKPAVGVSTFRGYQTMARLYVLPALGRIKLDELTPFRIQEWIKSLSDRKLSYASVRHAFVVLDMALEQAHVWNMIARNPAKVCQLPKKSRKQPQVFSAEQVHRFLASIATANPRYLRYEALFHVLLLTGLRPGEAGALRWSDLRDGQLFVSRALEAVSSGKWAIREWPKTDNSVRAVTVPKLALAALDRWKARLAAEQMQSGARSDLMFPTTEGTPQSPKNMHRAWVKLCEHAGVPAIRLYDARHTAASLELAGGADMKLVSARRGHASVGFTLQTYVHLLPGADRAAATALDDLMEKAANG